MCVHFFAIGKKRFYTFISLTQWVFFFTSFAVYHGIVVNSLVLNCFFLCASKTSINDWIESWTSRTIHSFTIISLAKIVLIKHCLISPNNHSISRFFWSVDFYRRKRVIESYMVNWTLNVFLVTHCFVPDGKLKLSIKWTPYCEKSSFLLKLKIWQNQRDHNKKRT